MKKNLIISLLIVLVNSFANAQITTYSSADNEEYAVFEVEDMYPDEIKTYNSWISDGLPENVALMYINAGRAQTNLINAPATIVDFHFDSGNQDVDGTVRLFVELINTSPKTINSASDAGVYSVKSADGPAPEIPSINDVSVVPIVSKNTGSSHSCNISVNSSDPYVVTPSIIFFT